MGKLAVVLDLKKNIKDILKNLHDMGDTSENCIYLLQTSFIYNSKPYLDECRTKLKNIFEFENAASKGLKEFGDSLDLMPYAAVPSHFLAIGESLEKLAQIIDKKIKEEILFSGRAVDEITFLLQRLMDILRTTSDMILARNEILGRYIQESEAEVIRKALEYATFHEERLIEGICSPAASTLYLGMLDAIKNIAWNAKQIAVKLIG